MPHSCPNQQCLSALPLHHLCEGWKWTQGQMLRGKGEYPSIHIRPPDSSGSYCTDMASSKVPVIQMMIWERGRNEVWQVEKLGHATAWGRVHPGHLHSSLSTRGQTQRPRASEKSSCGTSTGWIAPLLRLLTEQTGASYHSHHPTPTLGSSWAIFHLALYRVETQLQFLITTAEDSVTRMTPLLSGLGLK